MRVVTGDTKVVPRGAADGLFVTTAGVGIIPDGPGVRAGAARRPGAALGHHGRPRHGRDARPRRPRHRGRHRAPTPRPSAAWSSSSGRPRRRCGSCATPPAAASARSPTSWPRRPGSAWCSTSRRSRSRRWSTAPARCSASTRSTSPTRARCSPSSRRRRPPPGSPRCGRTRWARDAVDIGEIVAEPAATVVLRTAFGGTRIVDMLVGDPLPADLLGGPPCAWGYRGGSWRSPTPPTAWPRWTSAACSARSACKLLERDLPGARRVGARARRLRHGQDRREGSAAHAGRRAEARHAYTDEMDAFRGSTA